MKILPVGAELFHADGWRDGRHDEYIGRFSQFCENDQKLWYINKYNNIMSNGKWYKRDKRDN